MFQNWSTKDEIETSIRTFHISTGTKLKTHFLKLNEEVTKMGGKTYSILFSGWYIIMKLHQNKMVFRGGSMISIEGGGGGENNDLDTQHLSGEAPGILMISHASWALFRSILIYIYGLNGRFRWGASLLRSAWIRHWYCSLYWRCSVLISRLQHCLKVIWSIGNAGSSPYSKNKWKVFLKLLTW